MIYLKNLNIRGMADVYDLFGLTYLKKKEYNTAIENFNTCLQYRTMLFSQNEIAESNIFLGLAHKEIKDYGRSYKYYKTALSLAIRFK